MLARVVTKKDGARLAAFVTAAAALFLLLVLADDAIPLRRLAPGHGMFQAIAVAMAVAGVGPWLTWSRRHGRVVQLRCHDHVLEADRLRIAAADVRAISVAHAARGASVAIEHGRNRVTFLEVERREDAARIATTLETDLRRPSDVVVLPGSRAASVLQAAISLTVVIAAPFYYVAAVHGYFSPGLLPEPKALFGLAGVVGAELSLLFLVTRQLWPNQGVALGRRNAWQVHAALHRARAARRAGSARALEDEEPLATSSEPAPIGGLERRDEAVGAWLARIDAMPSEPHAYRGDALKRNVLWDALADGTAPVDTRMAAARVLRRRHGEAESALVRVVDDPDVRLRVEAALDEHDDAERRIERLGPLFRARRVL